MFRPLVVVMFALAWSGAASAKTFGRGDLKVCGMQVNPRCVSIAHRSTLDSLGSFYYGSGQPPVAPAPRMGQPEFRLVFPDGYITGVVADGRFLSYGVNMGKFATGVWYRLPPGVTKALERLGDSVRPLAVSACSSRLSNTGPTLATLPVCAG